MIGLSPKGMRTPILCAAAAALRLMTVHAQERDSAAAKELASLMSDRQMESFAARDPDAPSRFIATLVVPNVQMLVVAAEYPAPAELEAQLAQKNYREVYAALHQPSSASSRFFLIDLGCDGLRSAGDAVDVLYEKGTTQTLFNGDWKGQQLSEAVYRERLLRAAGQYERLLRVLRDTLKTQSAATLGGGPLR